MSSIAILLVLAIIPWLLSKQKDSWRFFRHLSVVFLNLFVIEIVVYGFFLFQIHKGDVFFLIDNQKGLDYLIKHKIVSMTHLSQSRHNAFYQVDNELGYTVGRDKMYEIYASSNQGLRSRKDYSLMPREDILRIAAFGDSFVFCDGEPLPQTWEYYLENMVENLEVMNFGVSGYGLGQSYLRYLKDGLRYHPDIVLFNYVRTGPRDGLSADEVVNNGLGTSSLYRVYFWIHEDILKSKNVTPSDFFKKNFRDQFVYEPLGLSMDRSVWASRIFSVSNVGLFVKQIALKRIFQKAVSTKKQDDLEKKRDRAINFKILQNLLKTAKANKMIVIFFCGDEFFNLPAETQLLLRRYSDWAVYINSNKVLAELFAFNNTTRENLLNSTGHFNGNGNFLYAQAVAGILMRRAWGDGDRRFEFDVKKKIFINKGK